MEYHRRTDISGLAVPGAGIHLCDIEHLGSNLDLNYSGSYCRFRGEITPTRAQKVGGDCPPRRHGVLSSNVRERDPCNNGGLMLWADMLDPYRDLHVLGRHSVSALRNSDEILLSPMFPFSGVVGPNFIFMDDKASGVPT
ncbi:hypothetical protein AVEN_270829-1 [Araneus ventricosus]|uniref:Uncharacterized protein n=1 Tax=Araneus ventricosus TaxID=182803 RepID=A0A4Y2HYD3_ARAVE|nr:hypothetical protein AVEN_270829-1 [Araneus ventricosus]